MQNINISFEFFPPRSPVQQRRFWTTFGCLQTLNPEYISLTWGALGTSSQASIDVLQGLMADSKVPVAAHLTCVGHTENSIRQVITDLEGMGVTRFVALRGDQPEGQAEPSHLQHASDLVAILAEDPARDISVAAYPEAHPESAGLEQDIRWLKHKLDNGAARAITQFFFSPETFLRFRDKAQSAGITQNLVPGILPIHDIVKVQDFSAKCGAQVPKALINQFEKAGEAGSEAAQDCAVEQCAELIQVLHKEGVQDFHLYTLNQPALTYRVCAEVGGGGFNRSVYAAA